ncbi:MAG: hypothetical protein JNL60_13190 [Bacteroidia bacterium]|nr:hypothetical protein [Bacteroidia bacterium]
MKQFTFLMILLLCISCKRNYTCSCKKTGANLEILDETEFKIKAKDSKQGYQTCVNKYLDTNPTPGMFGEISCDIK